MNTKFKSLFQQILRSPQRFPVEAALGVVFFFIAALNSGSQDWTDVNEDIRLFFVPLVTLSFWLQPVNRWAYYASFFLFMPLMSLNLKPFLPTYGFVFTYVLAAILLLIGIGEWTIAHLRHMLFM